jgi:hypothetical protein
MTPEKYTIPSGWSLVIKQDFEGSFSGDEDKNGTITTSRSHNGTKSLMGSYTGDGAWSSWSLRSGKIGSFTEAYVSFFEYIESQALFNDEFWIAQFMKRGPNDELYQEVFATWWWSNWNDTKSNLFIVPQSAAGGGAENRFGGKNYAVPKGAWVQWEIHFRPNTSGNNNGFMRIYKDGYLWESAEGKDLNGRVDMTDMSILIGGVYTKLTWVMSDRSCSNAFPEGTDDGPRVTNFSSCPCPNQCPPNGAVPAFNRYFDDILIIKK